MAAKLRENLLRALESRGFVFFVIALTLVTFARAIRCEFVNWDDPTLIVDNPILRLSLPEAFKAAFGSFYFGDYLPLTLMSWWAEVRLFGLNSHEMHAVNVLIHAVNVALLSFYLLRLGFPRNWIHALVFLFALHPVQVECVMWASSRNSLLCACFVLIAALTEERSYADRGWPWRIVSLVAYLAANLAKGAAILLPLVFLVTACRWHGLTFRRALARMAPMLALAAILGILRLRAFSTPMAGYFWGELGRPEHWLELPVMVLNALAVYARLLVFPRGLSIIYPQFNLTVLAGMGALVSAGAMGVVYWFWRRTHAREYLFFATVILCFLGPVIQFLPRYNYLNDRYLYMPILGFAGLGLCVLRDLRWRWTLPVLGILLVATASLPALAFVRSAVWVSNQALWEDTVRKYPESAGARNNLGLAYQAQGRYDDAIVQYEQALASDAEPEARLNVDNNLAMIYSMPEAKHYDLEKAIAALMDGIRYAGMPENTFIPRMNLGILYRRTGRNAMSLDVLAKVRSDIAAHPEAARFASILRKVDSEIMETLRSDAPRPE